MRAAHISRKWQHYFAPVGGGGSILPLDIDFSTLEDGALPSPLVGATWAVSSGVAVNTPTLGAELLTDPGLEANYTAGKCDTLTKSGGTPTLEEETVDVHGGSKAQKFTAAAAQDRLNYGAFAPESGIWADVRVWGKRTTGSGGTPRLQIDQSGGGADQVLNFEGTAWTERGTVAYLAGGLQTYFFPIREVGSSSFDTVIVDDGSIKAIPQSELVALLPATVADGVVKAQFGSQFYGTGGVVVRANAQTEPDSFIVVRFQRFSTNFLQFNIEKMVSGTLSQLLSWQSKAFSAESWLEVQFDGDQVSAYYGESQIGTTQTISDAVGNKYHGIFGSSGVACTRFFCGADAE